MESQYEPIVKPGIGTHLTALLTVRNTGKSAAYDVKADWEIGDETGSWRTPFLSAGEQKEFKIIRDNSEGGDENYILKYNLDDYFSKENPSKLRYSVYYKDRFDKEHEEKGEFDIESRIQEADKAVSQPGDSEEISGSIRELERSMGDIVRAIENSRNR